MSLRSNIVTALLLATSSASFAKGSDLKKTPSLQWELSQGLSNPESATYDRVSKTIFISNVAGSPSDKDGKGWITRVSLDGKVLQEKFFDGLNAPKGLRTFRDTLWVADIDRIIGISISKGTITTDVTIPEAKFLNDVAVDGAGNVFVSDFTGNAIYKLRLDGQTYAKPEIYAEGEYLLENPNGLFVSGDKLIIGRWGLGIKPDFSTETLGSLAVKSKDQEAVVSFSDDFANIDGIEGIGQGRYVISDFVKGTLFTVDRDGRFELLLQEKAGAADIGYVPQQRLLLVPNLNDSTLKAYQL